MKPLCVITGGTSGIGYAVAQHLGPRYRTALIFKSKRDGALSAKQRLIESGHHDCEIFQADLSKAENIQPVLQDISAWGGEEIDVLVHAAGRTQFSFLMADPIHPQIDLILENILSTLQIVHPIARNMARNKKGRIVLLSSSSVDAEVPGVAAYAMSKSAVETFSAFLAREVYRRGVLVNCIRPGFIHTRMNDHFVQRFPFLTQSAISMSSVLAAIDYLLDPRTVDVAGSVLTVGIEKSRV